MDRNEQRIDSLVPISGQLFRAADYETAYSGKWHLANPYPTCGIAGFDVLNKLAREGKLAHEMEEATMIRHRTYDTSH